MNTKMKNCCVICDAPLGAALLTITQPDRFEKRCGVAEQGYSRQWLDCTGCGAATNALPDASIVKLETLRSAYYEVDFAGSNIKGKYDLVMALPHHQSDNAGRAQRIHNFLHAWLKPYPAQPSVLDIGAGTGVFLSRFLDLSGTAWRAVGIEPDPHAAAHLRSLDKFEVVEDLYRGQSEMKGFNLVTLNKVLEHVSDPVRLLKQVVQAVSDSAGILYVELPDKLTINRRPSGDNILGALHCHLYDPSSLNYLFMACNIVPLRIERLVEPSGKITVYGFACRPEMVESL